MIARTAPSTRCSGPQGQAAGAGVGLPDASSARWDPLLATHIPLSVLPPPPLFMPRCLFFFPSAPCLSICFCFPDWGQAMLEDL